MGTGAGFGPGGGGGKTKMQNTILKGHQTKTPKSHLRICNYMLIGTGSVPGGFGPGGGLGTGFGPGGGFGGGPTGYGPGQNINFDHTHKKLYLNSETLSCRIWNWTEALQI